MGALTSGLKTPNDFPSLVALRTDGSRAALALPRLIKAYREMGIFGHATMPEESLRTGIERGSREHANLVTLTVAIDYLRDADELWKAACDTWTDEATRWIFEPAEVVARAPELRHAMKKHGLTWRFKRDPQTWLRVATTLHASFESDPRNIFARQNWDAFRVLVLVRSQKAEFPFLSGHKILPLWLRMMHDACGLELKNLDQIPIPVDIHIARASFMLGVVRGRTDLPVLGVASIIDEAWREGAQGSPHYRLQADQPLWLLSKYGCSTRGDGREASGCPKFSSCPVSDLGVDGLISMGTKARVERRRRLLSTAHWLIRVRLKSGAP